MDNQYQLIKRDDRCGDFYACNQHNTKFTGDTFCAGCHPKMSKAVHVSSLIVACLGSFGDIVIEEQASQEETDRLAYLVATSEPGKVVELTHMKQRRVVWREGMAVPGVVVTADMVGMTFSEAIKLSMRK